MHELLAAIDTTSLLGLRDRALIALMGYTFARVGAAIGMKVEDFYVQKRRGWVRLHEKGARSPSFPATTTLISIWRNGSRHPDLVPRPGPALPYPRHGRLTDRIPLPQANVVYDDPAARPMRACKPRSAPTASALPGSPLTCRRRQAEIAQQMAGHESSRTTGLYDRRNDQIALDEVERDVI